VLGDQEFSLLHDLFGGFPQSLFQQVSASFERPFGEAFASGHTRVTQERMQFTELQYQRFIRFARSTHARA